MSKKPTKQIQKTPPIIVTQKPQVAIKQQAVKSLEPLNQKTYFGHSMTFYMSLLLIAFASFFVYVNSAKNNYVLDDHGIIKSNKITKAGIGWANIKTMFTTSHRAGDLSDLEHSLYRPVAKVIFAAEYKWGNGSPQYLHKWNIFYFMLCSVMLFLLIYHATKKNWILAFSISFLFAVHPIHTEVVSNIKSLDEILGGIGVIGALLCFHFYAKNNNILLLILALFSYCIGIFSKESTIVAVALAPLYMYYFTDANKKQIIITTAIMVIGAGLFLFMRNEAIGWFLSKPQKDPSALDNVLALTKLDQTKVGGYQMKLFLPTVIYLMGYYVYTLFVPHPLSCDYSYATVNVKGLGDWEFILSFLFFVGCIYYAVKTIKQKNIIGFGILWFLISSSIICNLFIVIGTSFGERLMFLPSIGFCIAIIGFIHQLFKYTSIDYPNIGFINGLLKAKYLFGILLIVGALYGNKTIERNKDWFKDFTLFSRDVKYFGKSTHLLFYWGNHLSSSEYQEILKSQGANPQQMMQANYDAINTFKESMLLYPALPSDGYNQYGKAYYNIGNIDSADYYYKKAHSEDSTNSVFMNNIGTIFFQRAGPLQRIDYYDSAMNYFVKAHKRDTTMMDYMNNMGAILGTLQKRDSAIKWFRKAYESDSLAEGAILSCKSIAVTYRDLGDSNSMRFWTNKANDVTNYRMKKLQNGGF